MEKIVPLSVCPNHCDQHFIVNAEGYEDVIFEETVEDTDLSQVETNAFGQPVDLFCRLSAYHLDSCSDWSCQKCGAKPYLIDCVSVWVQMEDISGWLLIPLEEEGYIYWTERDDGEDVKSIPAEGDRNGVFWYSLQEAKIYPLRGAESLDMYGKTEISTDYPELRLIVDFSSIQCEGQVQLF